jgi:hypothetical protein
MRIFQEYGSLVVATDVLLVHGYNKAGSLAAIAHALADANENIEYAYSATSPDARHGLMVVRASQPDRALKVLNSMGA